jgi:hypothetical protein
MEPNQARYNHINQLSIKTSNFYYKKENIFIRAKFKAYFFANREVLFLFSTYTICHLKINHVHYHPKISPFMKNRVDVFPPLRKADNGLRTAPKSNQTIHKRKINLKPHHPTYFSYVSKPN